MQACLTTATLVQYRMNRRIQRKKSTHVRLDANFCISSALRIREDLASFVLTDVLSLWFVVSCDVTRNHGQ